MEYLFLMYIRQQITEEQIAMIVPVADPATPMLNTPISSKFSNTLIIVAKIRKYRGVRLSPTARIKPDNRLKNTVKTMPEERIKRKIYASSIISDGTFIIFSRGVVNVRRQIETIELRTRDATIQ